MPKGIWALGLMGTIMVSLASAATTDGNTRELIVRLRDPQNTREDALARVQNTLAEAFDVDLINSEEGVVKLTFDSDEAMRGAWSRLSQDESVQNITENRAFYQPLVHYSFEEKALQAPVPQLGFAWFGGLDLATLPEVRLPGPFRAGADLLANKDWSMKNINFPSVGHSLVHPSVVTAVIDTGVDYNHEDLIGAMWRKAGKPSEVGYDFAHNIDRPYDVVQFDLQGCLDDNLCSNGYAQNRFLVNPGHGTHCAGHIAAVAGNSVGIQGSGAGTPLIGLKIFYDKGESHAGSASDAAAIKSIDYAIKNGAKIISASWGGPSSRADAERSELKQALIRAQKAGVLVVVAAGNSKMDQDNAATPIFPAAYDLDNMIVVAATDERDTLGSFSNYGGRSVHIAAPGVKVFSTTVGSNYSDLIAKARNKDGKDVVVWWNGTSMATPIVAGAVAAVWSKYPTLTYKQVRDRILRSARKVTGLTGKVSSGGVLDVAAALR